MLQRNRRWRKPLLILLAYWLALPFYNAAQQPTELRPSNGASAEFVFEVATIKPAKNDGPAIIQPLNTGIRAFRVTVLDLIRDAYGPQRIEDNRIIGAPSWASTSRYDIQAKVSDASTETLSKLNVAQRDNMLSRMLQKLLADRFNLSTHEQDGDVPAYELTIAKSGSRLKPSEFKDSDFPNGVMQVIPGQITGKGASLTRLAFLLQVQLGQPVVDKTGIAGQYDFTVHWEPEEEPASQFQPDAANTVAPSPSSEARDQLIESALQKQLGLTLRPVKTRALILVIDHVDKPTNN